MPRCSRRARQCRFFLLLLKLEKKIPNLGFATRMRKSRAFCSSVFPERARFFGRKDFRTRVREPLRRMARAAWVRQWAERPARAQEPEERAHSKIFSRYRPKVPQGTQLSDHARYARIIHHGFAPALRTVSRAPRRHTAPSVEWLFV